MVGETMGLLDGTPPLPLPLFICTRTWSPSQVLQELLHKKYPNYF
jgi:hypothetical protein